MPKINQEEYEVLKGMGSGWKWLARESNGNLYKHSEKPMKLPTRLDETQTWLKMDGSRFLFIKSTDEPYSIAELIEEYEKDYKGSWEHAIEFSREVFDESEETEVKNIEELKSWFEDDKLYVGEYVKHKINQLDEPEVLSQEEVDQAYKDGYEKGKQHTFYKGYLEGLADKENEPETVADVVSDFWKSFERLKEVMSMEVEEMEE